MDVKTWESDMWQANATANDATANETRSPLIKPAWRVRLIGLTVALLLVAAYFGTVAWFGQGLAADMRAGVRTVEPGSLVLDTES